MGEMMPYKPKGVRDILTKKLGMTISERDHTWLELHIKGLPTIRTKLSHNNKDIGPEIESRICKQLRVRKPFFHGLMDCSEYLQDYEAQVRKDPFPPFDVGLV